MKKITNKILIAVGSFILIVYIAIIMVVFHKMENQTLHEFIGKYIKLNEDWETSEIWEDYSERLEIIKSDTITPVIEMEIITDDE